MPRPPRLLGPGLILLLGLAAVVWTFDPPGAVWVERVYSRGLYPALSRLWVPVTGMAPVSLAGLLLVLLPFLLAFWLVASWQRRGNVWTWLWGRTWRVAAGGVLAYALFLLVWGANYGRQPVEVLFDLPTESATALEVETLAQGLVGIVQRDAPEPGQRNAGRALASLRRSLADVVREATGVSPTLPGRAKRLPPGMLLTFGNAGVIAPWTLEPHVDGALPEPARLAVAAHELAHIAGFAGEADADLVAAVAGLQADDAYARYATALRLFAQVGGQLPDASYLSLYEQLPDAAKADLADIREVSARYASPTAVQMFRTAYDGYLKSQGVEAGVADYSRTVDLLTHAWRQGVVRLEPTEVAAE